MDYNAIKLESEKIARRLGYSINLSLPSLSGAVLQKATADVVRRILCLHCVVAVAHGFKSELAKDWLSRNQITSGLSDREKRFINSPLSNERFNFMAQGESLWAFMWVVGKIETIDFSSRCSDGLVKMLPDLFEGESVESWSQGLVLKDEKSIVCFCDLAYRLHWSITDAHLFGRSLRVGVPPYVVIERRRALEWLLQENDWDDVVLDT